MQYIEKEVTVIIPVRNEERNIEGCIQSVLDQSFPLSNMEVFFVDGDSEDQTHNIIEGYREKYPELLFYFKNPKKTAPCAMNIGIQKARGKYIVRMDAHSTYASDYIEQCIDCLKSTGADNVGGVAVTEGKGYVGKAISLMLSSKFGVGNSAFRTFGEDGYVDTVPFGAFRREVFEKLGGYDERLTRNQDNEMNYRIRKNGGKIYLSNKIQLTYFCRNTIQGICKMAYQNGCWNVVTHYLCPGTMGIRHFVPLVFVISLILMIISHFVFAWGVLDYLWGIEIGLYVLLDVMASGEKAWKHGWKYFPFLMICFPLFHVSYGVGSFSGLLKITKMKKIQSMPNIGG